jgi:hypothetical protein
MSWSPIHGMPVAVVWVSVERPMVRLPRVCAYWHLMNGHEPRRSRTTVARYDPLSIEAGKALPGNGTVAEQAANAWRTLAVLTLLA